MNTNDHLKWDSVEISVKSTIAIYSRVVVSLPRETVGLITERLWRNKYIKA